MPDPHCVPALHRNKGAAMIHQQASQLARCWGLGLNGAPPMCVEMGFGTGAGLCVHNLHGGCSLTNLNPLASKKKQNRSTW
jgi:hypothetical protein